MLPATGVLAYIETEAYRARQQLMDEEALRLARLVNSEQQRIFEGAQQVLDAISGSASLQDRVPDLCQRLLAHLIHTSPRYNFAGVLGLDGHPVCASAPADRSIDMSDRAYFRDALQTGGFVIGEYATGWVSGQPAIHMAQPLRNRDGVVTGVIDVALSLAWLGRQIDHLALPPGASVAIMDRNGTVLARYPTGDRSVSQPLPADNRIVLQSNESHVRTEVAWDGRERIVGYVPLATDPKGLVIAVGLDKDTTFAAIMQADRNGLMLIAACVSTMGLAALFGYRLIHRPLAQLLGAADRWREGDFSARSGFSAEASEFGRLAATVDNLAMAQEVGDQSVPANLALLDKTGTIVAVNTSWRRFAAENGALDQDAFVGWNYVEIARSGAAADSIGPAATVADALPRLLAGELTRFTCYYPCHASGLERWFLLIGVPASRRDGGALIMNIDVSAVHRADGLESGRRFQSIFEQAAVGMALVGLNCVPRQVNDRLCQITGYRREELLATNFQDIIHPDDRDADNAQYEAVIAGTIPNFMGEKRFRRKDGTIVWVEIAVSLLRDVEGRPECLVGIAADITERKRAGAEVARANALLSAIGNCSPDPIYAKDLEDRYVFANPATLAVIGKPAEQVIGHSDAEWLPNPDQADLVMAIDRRVIASGRSEVVEETFDTTTLGARVFLAAKAPLRMDDGTMIGVVGVSSDITQLKATEAALKQEAIALEEAQVRASHADRMQALGRLAGGIAHDFNNILQIFDGAASLIALRPDDEAGCLHHARVGLEAVDRGSSITRRLLAFSHRAELRAEALDPNALLKDMQEIFMHTLGAAIEVQTGAEASLPMLLADKGQLETALVNLATNAKDGMPGGGRLSLMAESDVISANSPPHPSGLAPGRYVRLTVADTGVGMDAATLARATEPFFTTKRVGIGTGLGLPMVQGFAEQSGGALSIESSPGNGTRVIMWLPEAVSAKPPIALPPQGAVVITMGKPAALARVLLVDDERVIRETLTEMLERTGYRVLRAANGTEALALLSAGESVDLLLTDHSMPGMDGVALIGEAQKHCPGLPALLLTGYAEDDIDLALSGVATGAFSLLRKPVRAAYLIDRIAAALQARATATAQRPTATTA